VTLSFGVVACALLASSPPTWAHLAAPHLQSPVNNQSLQALPTFTWGGVRRADHYQFELAADRKFTSAVSGLAQGPISVEDTAITDDKTIPDGIYYWRVRAVSAADTLGSWSPIRTLIKRWTTAPDLTGPLNGASVSWPGNPLVLRWSPVPHATHYDIWIATDPALSSLVLGSVGNPTTTQGTVFAFPATLAPGQYYWAITPVDAENNRGPRSQVQSFTWTWPSTTTTNEVNSAGDATTVDEPQLSWAAIPGASSYQVEVNSSPQFPTGSKLCCSDTVIGTSLNPRQNLPNASTLYWRVRAIDPLGDGGSWNDGPSFSQSFDTVSPANPSSVPGLRVLNTDGSSLAGPDPSTSAPIVTWDPVPGASSYDVQVIPYTPGGPGGVACNAANALTENTTNTYWTPYARGGGNLKQPNWPHSEDGITIAPGAYCFAVAARRDDGSTDSSYTYLGGTESAAFTFTAPAAGTGPLSSTPTTAYVLPGTSDATPTVHQAPLFTWNPVDGANGYYVIVARDQYFTDIVDVGFSDVTAYSPRRPFPDEQSAYWWAVVPSADALGSVFKQVTSGLTDDNPQSFDKSSIPPTPVSPVGGANASTDPTFEWTSAVGARNYTIQIAGDQSFTNPIAQVTTDATSFTAEQTLPADKTLFWRVRANDSANDGLNWSATASFTHRLPIPAPVQSNPTGGEAIPDFAWSPVDGAVSYSMHVDQADGTTRDFTVDSPNLSPTLWWGTGIWRFEVRANYPNGVSGGYFSPEEQYVRVENPPTGVRATKAGRRIIISWNPDPNAKQYRVALSSTQGFGTTITTDSTDNTSWVPQIDAPTAKVTLYWRVAAIDQGGNVGAYATGVFHAPRPRKHQTCARSKHRRCLPKITKLG
jgi:hypothetical protein